MLTRAEQRRIEDDFLIVDHDDSADETAKLSRRFPNVPILVRNDEEIRVVESKHFVVLQQPDGTAMDIARTVEAPTLRLLDAEARDATPPLPYALEHRGVVAGIVPEMSPSELGPEWDIDLGDVVWRAAGGERVRRRVTVDHPSAAPPGTEIEATVRLTSSTIADGLDVDLALGGSLTFVVALVRNAELLSPAMTRIPIEQTHLEDELDLLTIRLLTGATGRTDLALAVLVDDEPVGSIELAIDVGSAEPHAAHVSAQLEAVTGTVADLTLLVSEQDDADDAGRTHLTFWLNGPSVGINFESFDAVVLEREPDQYFAAWFAQVEALFTTEPDETTGARLRSIGGHLADEVLPAALQQRIFDLRDRVSTLFIQSTDPWIPWEFLHLSGETDDGWVEAGHLCEIFDTTRWIQGNALHHELRLDRVGLVVTGDSSLHMSPFERSMVFELETDDHSVREIESSWVDVHAALGEGSFTCLHFTGHGEVGRTETGTDAAIVLRDGQRFSSAAVTGRLKNLGRARPFVFFNACQAGRQTVDLVNPGGWARALIGAGASAFLGSHWPVRDATAARFARIVYDGLLDGQTLPAAVRAAREAIKADGDPTWLAYTLYSAPFARLAAEPNEQR